MVTTQLRNERINEIIEFAKKNNNTVGYTTVVDILKNNDDSVNANTLDMAINELISEGIKVEPSDGGEDYLAEAAEPDTFIPAEVNIKQTPITVYNLIERLENNEIDLEPAFQRRGNLWTLETQSQLIESLMLKIPIPAFYFDASDEENWIVIDGLQRLSAFQNFLIGTEHFHNKNRFSGLQYLKDFNGFTFDDLPRQYIRRIKETAIIAYTVEKGTPEEVVFNIFQRINTGGLPLSDQEIRQALYQGRATAIIQELAESKEFCYATRGAVKPDRMLDREYVTRFLAFTEVDYRKEYKGNIDNFLIKGLKRINNYDNEQLSRIKDNFKRVMVYCHQIFGKYAFRRYNKEWRRGPINKAIFEIWAICFTPLSACELDMLVKRSQKFLEAFQALLQSTEFTSALKAGDQYSLIRRVDMAKKLVEEFL